MNIKLLISHQKQQIHSLKREIEKPVEQRANNASDRRLHGEIACAQGILRVLHRAEEFAALIEVAHG